MSRKYSKRTKKTSRKTYQDYLQERASLEIKGYKLKEQMTEKSFTQFYDRLIQAKREGEIKSGAWQTLLEKEKYVSNNQAKVMKIAFENKYGTKITTRDVRSMTLEQMKDIWAWIYKTKQTGIYGGHYE